MTAAALTRRIGPAVQWRDWDGEIVAYNDRTGDTHHFADLAAWLFRLLVAQSLDEAAIHEAAENQIELPEAIDRNAAIARTIALFDQLELTEAA
jgi:PqqD family protein of HPr-rel-A system